MKRKHVIFVNGRYGNEATLNVTLGDDIESSLTWQQLAEEVLGFAKGELGYKEFMESYSLSRRILKEKISPEAHADYMDRIEYDYCNHRGASAMLFDLIRDAKILPIDTDGTWNRPGFEMWQTTANDSRKSVVIATEAAAEWLTNQLDSRGIRVEIKFLPDE